MENLFLNAVVLWFLAGLLLMLAELLLPGLIIIFFGVGAWVVALCCLLFDIGVNAQFFIFIISSVLSLALLRKIIKNRYIDYKTGKTPDLQDEYSGKIVEALEDFDEQGRGKVSFNGTAWNAVLNDAGTFIRKGEKLRITGFESITLFVTPLKKSLETL